MSKMTHHATQMMMTPKPPVDVLTVLEVHGMFTVPLENSQALVPVMLPLTGSGGETNKLPKTLEHATHKLKDSMLLLTNAPPVLPAVLLPSVPTL